MLWQDWSQQGLNAMGKLVADIIVETLQNAGVKHCYGVVGDTLNLIARSLEKSEIEWVSVRHEEAGAFAAQAEAQVADRLTAVAGSCGPGSLHFINGIFEANRNRAPVILIASQIIRDELGFDFIQEVDFKQVYQGLQRLLRYDTYAGAGAPEDGDRLPNGPGETRCRRSDRAGGHLRLSSG